jgi:hypothetical protein
LKALRDGHYTTTAAQLAGLHPDTLRNWCHRGEQEIQRVGFDTVEDVVQDWLEEFTIDFEMDNPLWTAEPPVGFRSDTWAFVVFVRLYKYARAIAEVTALSRIRAAADWQAEAWFLERTRPEKYAVTSSSVAVQAEVVPEVVQGIDTTELLRKVEEILANRDPDQRGPNRDHTGAYNKGPHSI